MIASQCASAGGNSQVSRQCMHYVKAELEDKLSACSVNVLLLVHFIYIYLILFLGSIHHQLKCLLAKLQMKMKRPKREIQD